MATISPDQCTLQTAAGSEYHCWCPLPCFHEGNAFLSLLYSKRVKRSCVKTSRDAYVMVLLVTRKSGFCLVARQSVDCAIIVTKLRKPRLNRAHGCVGCRLIW